ncbi:MAG TPA: hypothetical protein VFQ23_05635 [Anaerolineales bacterium]|nr:hypothetical protein [Anaerolineales bacterium]
MFSFFKKKDQDEQPNSQGGISPVLLDLRKTLYTNESLDPLLARIQVDAKSVFPWSNFVAANQALKENNKDKALTQLKEIVATPQGLETRIRLQAWHTLVALGELPIDTLRGYTQGVVMENHTVKGLDVVAGYSDNSARYWNNAGTGVIWDARDPEIDKLVFNLLSVGFEITKRIGVGLRDTPPVPEKGFVRFFIMAFDGSTVGEGRYDQLSKDPMGRVAIDAGLKLMSALMKKQKDKNQMMRYSS